MINELSPEAIAFGAAASGAIASGGGDELAVQAEAEPSRRASLVEPILDGLGAWDLDPMGSADEAEGAAALCRTAGYWSLPYPVAERLLRPRDIDADGLLLIDPAAPAAAVGALTLRWCATDLEGHRSAVSASAAQPNPRKDGYVVPLELTAMDDIPAEVVAMGLVLPCWTLLGMMDRAIELTRSYILERKQFGQPIAAFQGVQFQLTEAEVDRLGLHELAKYSLWSVETRQPHAVTDALALRAAALDAAALVFRVAHQLHGAIGFCDETPLSWVSRASVPLRRYPFTAGTARAALVDRIDTEGLVGPFSC